MNGYQAYCLYSSIKLHFSNESYDAFKYNFRANLKQSSFEKRRDRYFFDKIARRFSNVDDLKLFFVDNVMSENVWIGDMDDDTYTKRDSYRQSLFYNYQNEVKLIREQAYKYNLDFDGVCKPNSNKSDNLLLNLYTSQQVSPDTLAIIDHFVGFIKSLKRELSDPLGIVESSLLTLHKYQQFIIPLIRSNQSKYRNKLIMLFTQEPNQYNIEFVGNNTSQYNNNTITIQ
jgi:hypothetical protein